MKKKAKKFNFRVVTFLNRNELDFLDELTKDIYFTHGIHIPRTKLIEEIIDAFKDGKGINKKEIEQKLCEQFKKEDFKKEEEKEEEETK